MIESEKFNVGVIGYGNFGQVAAKSLAEHVPVIVTDKDRPDGMPRYLEFATMQEVCDRSNVLILSVPYQALPEVLDEITPFLADQERLVVDVTSTKVKPLELLQTTLPKDSPLLATHPLFGPPSVEKFEKGQQIVVCHESGLIATEFRAFLEETYGLVFVELTAEEHDYRMAHMQAMVFFIARALASMELEEHNHNLFLPSFDKLKAIIDIERQHTLGLFDTVVSSNPYSREVIDTFIGIASALHEREWPSSGE